MSRNPKSMRACLLVLSSLACAAPSAQDDTAPVRYEYDAEGNQLRRTDPRGIDTLQQFDRFHRPVARILPAPVPGGARPAVSMAYDHLGALARSSDPRGLSTAWRRNGLGNLVSIESPDSGTTLMDYDAAGLPASVRDARGVVTSYTHDALGRVIRIDAPGGAPARFEYDSGAGGATGRLTRMTDESGETRYRYDDAGRLVGKTQEHGGRPGRVALTVGYAYGSSGGAAGKLEALTYPSGSRVVLGYSGSGRVVSMTLYPPHRQLPVTLLGNVAYEPFGAASGWEWGRRDHPPTLYRRERDLDGRLVRYTLSSKNGKRIERTVVYDAAGRVERYLHASEMPHVAPADQAFSYDDLGRLTGFVARSTAHSFDYDASGNRTRASLGQAAYRFSLDPRSNRLLSAAGGADGTRSYRYDSAGNVTGDGRLDYTYGPGGRIRSVRGNGWEASYLYNGLGQRVAKQGERSIVPGGARLFVHDEAGRLLGEYDALGNAVEETVFLGDTPVAVLTHASEQASESAIKVHYVFTDHLGAPRLIERAESGTVVWRWDDADPFGVAPPVTGHMSPWRTFYNRRFTGQYYDAETGQHFEQGRSYDPLAGRLGQPVPSQLSPYPYAANNPLLRTAGDGIAAPAGAAWRDWGARPATACMPGAAGAAPALTHAGAWPSPAASPGTGPASADWVGATADPVR